MCFCAEQLAFSWICGLMGMHVIEGLCCLRHRAHTSDSCPGPLWPSFPLTLYPWAFSFNLKVPEGLAFKPECYPDPQAFFPKFTFYLSESTVNLNKGFLGPHIFSLIPHPWADFYSVFPPLRVPPPGTPLSLPSSLAVLMHNMGLLHALPGWSLGADADSPMSAQLTSTLSTSLGSFRATCNAYSWHALTSAFHPAIRKVVKFFELQ